MTTSLSIYFSEDAAIEEGKKTYVLDTSVLLSDPNAMYKFDENKVIIPITVIRELEHKRTDLEIGYYARTALRNLEAIRLKRGELNDDIYLDSGGILAISTALPEGKNNSNDEKIIHAAFTAQLHGEDVVVVSKDLPMRILASIAGLGAEEYRSDIKGIQDWSGIEQLEVEYEVLEQVFADVSKVDIPVVEHPPVNAGIVLKSGNASALVVHLGEGNYERVSGDAEVFGVAGRSAEQKIAIAHLLAKDVGIVSLGGKAGTGKSALALLAGIEAVLEEQAYKKIIVFRPLYAVGGQELGYLPGDQDEKMGPWAAAIQDTLGPLVSENVMNELMARNLIEVLPLTHIRGRTLSDTYVIVDEAQNIELSVLVTALTRLGQNSKVVLTHDTSQRDNLLVGKHDGISAVIDRLKGQQLFAHVTLRKTERSAIARLVSGLFDL